MSRSTMKFALNSACFAAALIFAADASAQVGNNPGPRTGVTIQLPSFSVFNVNTVVSVPDGGTTSLGGLSRYDGGRTSRGVPLLGNAPFASRPFRNQAFGQTASAGNASVNVRIISLDEQEAFVLEEAERRAAYRRTTDPNGPLAIQRRADFLSKHIGRRR